ncbi:hypothetical protein OEA41_001744 [Lepraria neglecta]|uniref:URB1 N-terminal domain-containing protein n=1 Tax=Lepraria neglecta TaxID=209136 RepID=A0AAE0DPA9_9LECA|nr:hypothetical protein OEA41_001744 [Lepraria neglecta]
MAKRTGDSDEESPHKKRRKLTKDLEVKQPIQPIQTSKDLGLLLAFDQDAGPRARQKIQSFRSFVESIAYSKEGEDRAAKRELLLEYLQSQAPSDAEGTFTYLADIIKTWHFAAQSNVEGLFSAVAAVLALLLRTISSLIKFRVWGNHLCKTLLQDDQMTLFNRGLTANKTKEHLISPCLRLLTEIVSFDGGHAARSLFRQRETTFNRLETFLGMRMSAHAQDRKRASLRDNALQFLYANFRLQNPAAKVYILAQGRVVRAWFEDITEDSPSVVLETLEVLKKHIAMDAALTISTRSRFFTKWILGRLATLYGYDEADNLAGGQTSVQKSAHEFLQFLCTSPGLGVLESPHGSHRDAKSSDSHVATSSQQDRFIPDKPPKEDHMNAKLASFLQTLRPHASVLQSDLIIAVFRNTSELVSDYFSRKNSFSFDPKATATWVGYSSFLLATVQIPPSERLTPKSVNDRVPSSYARIIESIIPHPLNQKVMTRCLNQSSDLIKFLALKILTAGFEKLAKVLRICKGMQYYTDENHCAVAWDQTASKLTIEFSGRVPDMEAVIAQFRSCPRENVILRESITRLLALYYEVVPQLALEQKFDISMAFSTVLGQKKSQAESLEEDGIQLFEIEHLLLIAHRSPNMQWFHKPGT